MKYLILSSEKTDLLLLMLNFLILNTMIRLLMKQSQLLLLIKKSYTEMFMFLLNASELTILCLNSLYAIILTLAFKMMSCSNISLSF